MSSITSQPVQEVVFIGLPGPTHHYSGLSDDNVAASENRGTISNPREAALQVLELARILNSQGVPTAFLPPQLRPHLPSLRQHFTGNDESVILQASREAFALLEEMSSSSAMWVANAATVAPQCDTRDHKLHITTANLFTHMHRRIEAEDTHRVLSTIFANVPNVQMHAPLSAVAGMMDEGAANHMRLSPTHSHRGLHVFVYGADGREHDPDTARQSLLASKQVGKLHALADEQQLYLRQNPYAIKQGVFHNDVIAVSNGNVLLVHEMAYDAGNQSLEQIREAYEALHPGEKLHMLVIDEKDLSVDEDVHTYFFNSQIVTRSDGGMTLIAPQEVQELYDGKALGLMEAICRSPDNPIDEMHVIDLRQSMRNGGGPACLRLRVPLTNTQLAALSSTVQVMATDELIDHITQVVESFYPECLHPEDVGNPDLYHCCQHVLGALSTVMHLPLITKKD